MSTYPVYHKGTMKRSGAGKGSEMTRKHFIKLAMILKAFHASLPLCQSIADVCADTNPNFDRTRFIRACECL